MESHNNDNWAYRDLMKKAGLVIDVAARAPSPSVTTFALFASQPERVEAGRSALPGRKNALNSANASKS